MRVFLYDDYVHAPEAMIRELFAFLGVEPDHPIDTSRRHNVSMMPRWPMLHARLRPLRRSCLALSPRAPVLVLSPQRFDATPEERARALRCIATTFARWRS